MFLKTIILVHLANVINFAVKLINFLVNLKLIFHKININQNAASIIVEKKVVLKQSIFFIIFIYYIIYIKFKYMYF